MPWRPNPGPVTVTGGEHALQCAEWLHLGSDCEVMVDKATANNQCLSEVSQMVRVVRRRVLVEDLKGTFFFFLYRIRKEA